MAIVPLTNDVSIKTIRDVINQKAIVLGQLRYRGTTYGRYGGDQSTGEVQVALKNIQPTDTITITITLTNGGSQVETLTPGEKKYVTFTSLPGNSDYDLMVTEVGGAGRSASINDINIATSGSSFRFQVLALFSDFPIVNISMVTTTSSVTANYTLRDGVSIPRTVTTTDSGLSQWRGSQVVHGTIRTTSSGKGRYSADRNVGRVILTLDPIGFSDGPVTVTLPNVNSITKNLGQVNNKDYTFNSLQGKKSYIFYIKDGITGVEVKKKVYIGLNSYGANLTTESYSFNGDSQMLAFTL